MLIFSACSLFAVVDAKVFPYSKNYEFLTVPNGTINATKDYEMGVTFTITQEAADTPMIFNVLTSIYPSKGFATGNIYQAYVQFEGMAETSYSNTVCNMIFSEKKPTYDVKNSCGTTLFYTLTFTKYSQIVGDSTACAKPWTIVPEGTAFTVDANYNNKKVANCTVKRPFL